MKTTIVCGLLGSGKTTFIRNSLRDNREKTVVLVNDFGSAGIDGEILSAEGLEAVELPSGCVCCSLKFELISTIKKITERFSPDQLVIEPSGVASPSGIIEALESVNIKTYSVVGIVDVTEFAELYDSGIYGSFFQDQISLSDIILLNKIDLAGERAISAAESRVQSVNPRAVVFRTQNSLSGGLSLSAIAARGEGQQLTLEPFTGRTQAHFRFESLSFDLAGHVDLARFLKVFQNITAGCFGTVVRAKALVSTDKGPYRVDGVFGKVDCVRFERKISDSRLVIIGIGLNRHAIESGLHAE